MPDWVNQACQDYLKRMPREMQLDIVEITTCRACAWTRPSLALLQLRRLMRAEGWDVDVPRMCLDTAYAHHCLATAHTSSSARLRQTALALFETYGRNSTPPLH